MRYFIDCIALRLFILGVGETSVEISFVICSLLLMDRINDAILAEFCLDDSYEVSAGYLFVACCMLSHLG